MLAFVIGGAACGKSGFAEALVCSLKGERIYLATMAATDAESLERIERHRRLREGKNFQTLEIAMDLASAELPTGANVLLEDLSNLLANEMFSAGGGGEAVRRGIAKLVRSCENLTVVSNDIFQDTAPAEPETAAYMKELAALNRELAAEADLAVEVVCGLPNVLKGELP